MATFVVDSTSDITADDGFTTLREAIALANASPDPDTIVFDASLHGARITLDGAALSITEALSIEGPGAGLLTIDADARSRVFSIDALGKSVSIAGVSITGGRSPGSNGGGIYSRAAALTLDRVQVYENEAAFLGGGVTTDFGGTLLVRGSTFWGNRGDSGGALWVEGVATIESSTFTGNTGVSRGGAIAVEAASGGHLIRNSTIVNNTVESIGLNFDGGGVMIWRGDLTFVSSIIAGNADLTGPNDIGIGAVWAEAALNPASAHNLLGTSGADAGGMPASNGNLLNADPRLLPLANYGGPVQTRGLAPDSPAIDAGANPAGLAEDQRGLTRVRGDGVDIGAFEYRPAVIDAIVASTSSVERTSTLGLSVTIDAGDGGAASVEYYLDSNADLQPEPGERIAQVSAGPGFAFEYTIPASLSPGGARFLAVAFDPAGRVSIAADVRVDIANAAPTLSEARVSLASVRRGEPITLSVAGFADADGSVTGVEYFVDQNNDGIADPSERFGLGKGADFRLNFTPPADTPIGAIRFLAIAQDADGGRSAPAAVTAIVLPGRPSIDGLSLSANAFAQGDTVTLVAQPGSGDSGLGEVRFYLDANADGALDAGDTLLGIDADGSDGFTWTLPRTQSGTLPVGQVAFIAVPSDGAGDDAAAIGVAGEVAFSVRAGEGRVVRGAAAVGDEHVTVTVTAAGDVIVFEETTAQARNLTRALGLPSAIADALVWTGPDGLTRVVYPSSEGLVKLDRSGPGAWLPFEFSWYESIPAVDVLGIAPSVETLTSLTLFKKSDGLVVIAGVTEDGRLFAYEQLGLIDTGPVLTLSTTLASGLTTAGWASIDISAVLSANGFQTPTLTSLISYRPAWDAWHLAGLDEQGRIISVWSPPTAAQTRNWRVDNLSNITGATPLEGGLSVILTSWNGITLTGLDAGGSVQSVWWVPQFAGNWERLNMTQAFNGPRLSNGALTSFYTPWNAQNYAGVDEDGAVVVYWWVPQFGGEWRISRLTEVADAQDAISSALNAYVSDANTLNVFGASAAGDVVRASWRPGEGLWTVDNLSEVAVRA